jgi:hypothetical protein
VHLTNVAVQKADKSLEDGEEAGGSDDGSKWGLQQLKLHIASRCVIQHA